MSEDNDVGQVLAEICEAAAALILPLWRTGVAVTHKSDESPVTEADQRGEKLILEQLAARFPDIPVISEEDASEFGTPDAIGPRFSWSTHWTAPRRSCAATRILPSTSA